MKVGIPMIKLDTQAHPTAASRKNSGNARAVVCEGLSERWSSDPDLDRSKTNDNLYFQCNGRTVTSGKQLVDEWEQMADAYRVTDKNGRQKKLRSDAGIGFAMVIKPDASILEESDERQGQFLVDAVRVVSSICKQRGLVIDAAVIHDDERVPHVHLYGHDPEYKLGKKLGLPLKAAMNRTAFPPMMRKLGWPVEDLIPDQDDQTKHGLSSEEYKAKRRAKDIETEATQKASKTLQEATERLQAVEEREAAQKVLQDHLTASQREVEALRAQAAADAAAAAEARAQAEADREAAAADRKAAAEARKRAERLEGIAVAINESGIDQRQRTGGKHRNVSDIEI